LIFNHIDLAAPGGHPSISWALVCNTVDNVSSYGPLSLIPSLIQMAGYMVVDLNIYVPLHQTNILGAAKW